MKKKLTMVFFVFISSMILSSCEDIFLRFKYEKFQCLKNKFGIEKIWLTKQKLNSNVPVLIKSEEYNFKIFDISDNTISLKLHKPNIILKINKLTKNISGVYQKNIFNLNCMSESFRI